MKLRQLSSKTSLKGKRVLVRVDWNVPLQGSLAADDSLKMTRSYPFLLNLVRRGAVVVVMTHLGRPKGVEKKYSTQPLVKVVRKASELPVHFLPDLVDSLRGLAHVQATIRTAKPGSIFLLENVRFLRGEEENSRSLAKALASLGDLFINDAFASCHRTHASVVGVAGSLPSYASPTLVAEIRALSRLIQEPRHPYVAIIGGAKLSTKMGVLKALTSVADRVLIGGAMAHPFFAAKGLSIGKSLIEKQGIPSAKKLLKNKKIGLPIDVVVQGGKIVSVDQIGPRDIAQDIGPKTLEAWSRDIASAKMLIWNGPVGRDEDQLFAWGSRRIARWVGARGKSPACFCVAGGGDTLPLILSVNRRPRIDYLSTGGGAMLEFLANHGKLPGLKPLIT